ncbi:hypothetical protein PF005_g30937 [Phytophthora fragariae]|uniref:Uncharacterized protein n=1 Tax=Phytophthora fragariae TaxID=53985 RepID=A0A6A3V8W7_9STRA|nr:hypothetical protein PF003_g80 [Phytophthora fragariae]KAE8915574.1 hypothetical protein PF003_g81 [Phytophthora fragariae]KAE8918584.1 hypothetical protein PF009_g31103 [Phytophthora fragariae]KAE8960259.1 hypothetical protein PF011_g30157 [Phytophthora fragariae]KAE9059520.1 hypothetical protein PF010_g30584 [Phytophthora fragariae]
MFQFLPPAAGGPKFDEEAAEIERFRARHRRLHRDQPPAASSASRVEALDEDGGRRRKVSAKWRHKHQQQQAPHRGPFDDAEMLVGFNAFDFSASPEAFHDEPQHVEAANAEMQQQQDEEERRQHMAQVAQQVSAMGFNTASLWEQRLPGLRQPGGPIRQVPAAIGQSSPCLSLWRPPAQMPFAPHDDQRRCLHSQAQFFA